MPSELSTKKRKKRKDSEDLVTEEIIKRHEEGKFLKKKKRRKNLESEEHFIKEINSKLEEREVPLKKVKTVSERPVLKEVSSFMHDDKISSTVEGLSMKKKKKHRKKTDSEMLASDIQKLNSLSEETEITTPYTSMLSVGKKKKKRASEKIVAEKVNSVGLGLHDENHITQDKFHSKTKKLARMNCEVLDTENRDGFHIELESLVKKKKKVSSEKKEGAAYPHSFDQGLDSKNEGQKAKDSAYPRYNKLEKNISNAYGDNQHTKFNRKLITLENMYSDINPVNYKRRKTFFEVEDEFVEFIPTGTKGRHYTISIAVPASILHETCLKQDLRTYVIGQLARAACIYSVDEIIVYDDHFWKYSSMNIEECIGMMSMILEYQECPQYLRKSFFPVHPYLYNVGVLNALNASHHLLAHQWCPYREGVVVSKRCTDRNSCFADVGLKSYVLLDTKLNPGHRVTVHFPRSSSIIRKNKVGSVVPLDEPRTKASLYWGYTVRVANSLTEMFKSDRFKDGYDLIIGTSDKGTDSTSVTFKTFSHALIVFGGVQGLEAAMEADETITASNPTSLFPFYLNVCPNQASRTIRTEEAVLIALSVLCPKLAAKGKTGPT